MKIPCYDIRKGNYARLQHWFVAVYQGTIVPTVQQMDDAIAVYHAAVHPYTTQEDTRFNWWIHLFPDLGKYADQLVAVYDFRVADEAMMAWRSANYPLNELGYA